MVDDADDRRIFQECFFEYGFSLVWSKSFRRQMRVWVGDDLEWVGSDKEALKIAPAWAWI